MMEEEECNKMLDHLQQYVPHLEKLIIQLKDPKRKNRELQLSKLEGLHSMITDRRKKLKLDTLKKCEDVILKILQKVTPNFPKNLQQKAASTSERNSCNMVKFVCKDPPEDATMALINQNNECMNSLRLKVARARLSEIYTPASPSPPRELPRNHSPILIPAEQVKKNDIFEKPDIYRLAAESLISSSSNSTSVENLNPTIDMSKPPLSEEDLLLLSEPGREVNLEETATLSMDELEDLRAAIKQKLIDTDQTNSIKAKKVETETTLGSSKTSKSNVKDTETILKRDTIDRRGETSRKSPLRFVPSAVHKVPPQPVPSPVLSPVVTSALLPVKPKTSPRIETVLKDPNSKFGDFLSSIDEKILKEEETKKKDKRTVEDPRRKSIDRKSDKTKTDYDLKGSSKPTTHNKKDTTNEVVKSDTLKEKPEVGNLVPSPPVYKRLADKYNPKPRKPSTERTEKTRVQEVKTDNDIRSPKESSISSKWFDRDPNFELPCDKSSLIMGISPNQAKAIPSLMGNQYIPNPNAMLQNKPPNYSLSNQVRFTSPPPSAQFMQSQPNQYIVPKHNQYGSPNLMVPSSNMMVPNQNVMIPSQNVMLPSQNIMMPSQNMVQNQNMLSPSQSMMVPHPNMIPTQNIMTQHNSGGNTFLNTYIVQNNVSSNVAHGHFNNNLNVPQNTYHNQMVSNKSFHPFQPIQSGEAPRGDYFHSQNKPLLLPTPNYPGYVQNSSIHSNRVPADSRKIISRDPRDRSLENNYRPKEMITTSRGAQSVNFRDPRTCIKSASNETGRRTSIDNPPNKYDALYANIDKDSEKFVSPLDSLYSGGETLQTTGKGYGFQKFRIPKRNEKQQPERHQDLDCAKHDDRQLFNSNESDIQNDDTQDDSDDEVITKERVGCKAIISPSPSPPPPPVISTSKKDAAPSEVASEKVVAVAPLQKRARKSRRADPKKRTQKKKEKKETVSEKAKSRGRKKVQKTVKESGKESTKVEKSENIAVQKEEKDEIETAQDIPVVPVTEKILPVPLTIPPTVTEVTPTGTAPSSENKIATPSETPADDPKATPNEEAIIANYLAGLFQKANKEELLSVILSSLTGGTIEQQQKKFRQIQKIVESDTADEGVDKKTETKEKTEPESTEVVENKPINNEIESEQVDELPKAEEKLDITNIEKEDANNEEVLQNVVPVVKIKKKVKRKHLLRKKKGKKLQKKSSAPNSTSSLEQPEQVIESVGERIKNRKRIMNTVKSRKIRKYRSELDMLHDDIKEMFIRDGILTATGKRMCRILKPEEQETSIKKSTRSKSIERESTSTGQLDSPKRRARSSNPKVIIEKTDLTKLVPAVTNLPNEKSDSESDFSVSVKKRTLRQTRKLVDTSSSTSESSLNSPIRKFPKRKIKNKPNYYEDPNDLSVPKQPEPEVKELLPLVKPPVSKKPSAVNNDTSDLEVATEAVSPIASPIITINNSKPGRKVPLIKKAKITLKTKLIKKKRPGWSLGVIKKKKRLSPTNASGDGDNRESAHTSVEQDVVSDLTPVEPVVPSPTTLPSLTPARPETSQDGDTILVEPDADYYFDPQDKPFCKICPFKGKFIVQHYKSAHPKYEVLISRISAEETKRAIAESVENNYEDLELPLLDEKLRKKKFTYKCRFCHTFFKNESTETFFDHLTSHTGEYRFTCTLCIFKTSNSKSLRSHYHSSHTASFEQTGTIFPTYEAPPSYHIVFGYVCSECNFIQLDQSAIRNHMQIYHLGDDNKINKINMSMIVVNQPSETAEVNQEELHDKNISNISGNTIRGALGTEPKQVDQANENLEVNAISTTEINDAEEPLLVPKMTKKKSNKKSKILMKKKSPPKRKPEPKKKLNNVNRSKVTDISNMLLEANEVPSITRPTAIEPTETAVKPVENMAAFQDSGEFDKDLFISKKVADNVPIMVPKRHSFNFLDRIKSRLEKSELEENSQQVQPNTNVEPMQTETIEEVFLDDINKPSCSYKTPKISVASVTQKENIIITKNVAPINSIIERLQGKLNSVGIAPNILDNQLIVPKTEEIVLQVGPITATKGTDYVLYTCNIKSCSFSTTIAHEFLIHCTNFHTGKQWTRFCNICDAVLEHCGFEITDAYKHLTNMHLADENETGKNEPPIAVNSPVNESPILSMNVNSDLPFKIISVETEQEQQQSESHDFPFLLGDYRTESESEGSDLTSEKPNSEVSGASGNLGILPLLTTPVNKSPPSLVPLAKTSLSGMASIPKTAPMNTIQPATPLPQKTSKRILLRDTPLQNEELIKERKSATALTQLLDLANISHLYKCPEFNCAFSTDFKRAFDLHINQHAEIPRDMQIPCVYCNYKTDFGNIAIHYDIRHAKCLFCCAYCLYRAINQSNVEMHQDIKHKGNPRCVYQVVQNKDAMLSQANITLLPLRDVIPPYLCGCKEKFLFESDILKHTRSKHGGILTCGYCSLILPHLEMVVVHMQVHNVHHHHCRYCVVGSTNTDDIYKHLSLVHFAQPPQIVVRRFDLKRCDPKLLGDYRYDDENVFDYLKIITNENFAYFSASALKKLFPEGQPTNKVNKLPHKAIKVLSNTIVKSDTTKDMNQSRSKSPLVINKLLDINTSLLDTMSSSVTDVENFSITNTNGKTPISDDVTTPTTASITTATTNLTKNAVSTVKVLKEKKQNIISSMPEKKDVENLNIAPSENDVSMENSLSDVMDLTLSDSGETHFSDLTAEESLFKPCNTKQIGLSGRDLFKCGFCKAGFDKPKEMRSHVVKCVEINNSSSLKPYKCAHCSKSFKNIHNQFEHLRVHGTDRFTCSLCDFKSQHSLYVRQHMKTKHKVTNVTVRPLDCKKQDYDSDEFIVRPKVNRQKSSELGIRDTGGNNSDEKNGEKLVYTPEEIDRLPFRPIFARDLGCSICGFSTKVKANLLRHLHLHLKNEAVPVPTAAPINPVPCLEKNEKMFDKMTNLSHSGYNSNSSRMSFRSEKKELPLSELTKEEQEHIPLFVPSTKRNVCGATSCDYLCLDDQMFKIHLTALHRSELFYKCKHCEINLSSGEGSINIDAIIKHQKLHDLCLYKCKYCPYLYNVKHKVESHILEEHSDKKVNVIVIREMTHEPIEISNYEREREPEEIKETKPWRCGMCKYKCTFKSEIVTHIFNKHEMEEGQHKCALCTFKSNSRAPFTSHFENEHPEQTVDIIDVYFKVEDKPIADTVAFDTTPLWKLNHNSNYIRGIPIEGSKSIKRSPIKPVTTSILENVNKSIESVVSGIDRILPKKTLKEKKIEIPDVIDDKLAKVKERRKSIPISKKLKALQEKEKDFATPVEIIEIEDDSGDTETEVDIPVKSDTVMEKEVEAVYTLTLEEIEQMDINTLIDSNFCGKFGPFGKPLNSKYLCPRCGCFKTSIVADITHHLYKELNYFKYICTICRLYGVTYSFLRAHAKNKHPHRPEAIIPLTPEGEIEDWVTKVIAVQNRIMSASKPPKQTNAVTNQNVVATTTSTVGEASSTANNETEVLKKPKSNLQACPHCNYTCKNMCDLRKHEKRHWLQKPLKCGHCNMEGVTNYEIAVHSKRAHPNLETSIIVIPTPNSPTIQPISRKRKRRACVVATPSDSAISDNINTSNESVDISNDTPSTEIDDKPIYLCSYCRKRCLTEDEIENHCKLLHSPKFPKYKKVLSSQVPKKHSINYKCFHCDFIGTLDAIKQHFKVDHPAQNLSVYRYQCSYCSEYFRKLEKVTAHCRQVHGDENPEELDIKLSSEPKITKDVVCEYCNLKYDTEKELLDHHKNVHSHIELNKNSDSGDKVKENSRIFETEPLVDERKAYKCPECTHSSHSFPSVTDHLRTHTKPLQCFYCNGRFIYPAHVKTHCAKEHPDLPSKYVTVDEAAKHLETLKMNLLVLKDGEYLPMGVTKSQKRVKSSVVKYVCKKPKTENAPKPTARKSTTQGIIIKETARKSTTQFIPTIELDDGDDEEDEGFSYYGTQPDMEGVNDLKTTISLEDKMVTMNVKQFSRFVDIFPTVPVLNILGGNNHL